jgi:hypothetical protein
MFLNCLFFKPGQFPKVLRNIERSLKTVEVEQVLERENVREKS